MPEIWNCPYCGRETYMGLASCPHCERPFLGGADPAEPTERSPSAPVSSPGVSDTIEHVTNLHSQTEKVSSVQQPNPEESHNDSGAKGDPLKLIKGMFGFVLAFAIAAVVEIGLLYVIGEALNSRLIPRGLGWLIIPVLSGIAGWKLARNFEFEGAIGATVSQLTAMKRLPRIIVAVTISWVLLVVAYVFIVEPFGYSISGREWTTLMQVLVIPPIVFVVIIFLFVWATRKTE